MIKSNKSVALMIISFMILSNIAFAQYSDPSQYEGKPIDESREGIDYYREGNIIVYPTRISSKEKEVMERFNRGDVSEEEMRAMARAKLGDDFSEMEFQKGMIEFKERRDRKEAFSYAHEGISSDYYVGPSYEGYSREHMIFGMIFNLIGDDIDPREIKQYCNDPNKVADIAIAKLKEEVGELQNLCNSIKEQESNCMEQSKKGCSQLGTAYVRDDASEMEKLNSIAYSCPVNKDAIKEACKKRNRLYMEQRLENIEDECKKRFDFEGERLVEQCKNFRESQTCNREEYIERCMGGIKRDDFGVKDLVKCVFKDSTKTEECYSDKGNKCSGIGTCIVDAVAGNKGEQVVWKSSCGGYAYTTIDGVNDYAEFECAETIKEQVKCVFENSNTEQKCYTDEGKFGCSGIGTCIADVSGEKGKKLTWKSSCGGYAYTVIDGINDYANFNCGTTTTLTECRVTGCSGEVCSAEDVVTTCEYRPEYDCYKLYGECKKQSDGKCDWTQSDALLGCIREKASTTTATSTQTTPPTTTTCPEVSKPTCTADQRLETYYDNAGCVTGYQCITTQVTCPTVEKTTCAENQSLTTKYDDKGCVTGYECVSVTTSGSGITGGVVFNTYEDLLRNCENSWTQQQRVCSTIPSSCDKELFIDNCKSQERANYDNVISQIDKTCELNIAAEIRHVEDKCSRIDKEKQMCIEQSEKRCAQTKGLTQQCAELMTEERLREFIVGEAKKRCKFVDIIEDEDDIREADEVEIVLAVLNAATEDDINKLGLFVDDLGEELQLEETTIYKGTIKPSSFGDVKLLPFVVNAKISTKASSERAKEVKARIVARQKVEEAASELVSLRDSDVPDEYLYIIEDKASDVLDVSDKLEEIEKKEEQKGLGYKIKLFLGLAKAAEKEEIKQLEDSKSKLQNSIDTLARLAEEVPSDVAKAILKTQVENLKQQQADIEVLIETKEKKSKGLLGIFG